MSREVIAIGRTIEEAKENGARELGVSANIVEIEVLEQPKKGFLGFGEMPAKVKVIYEEQTSDVAYDFVKNLLESLGIEADIQIDSDGIGRKINIQGEQAAVLIGHHGETLDALQYLANLCVNKNEKNTEYTRITVDIENYRSRREETLKQLAKRMASKVIRYKKNIALEPMLPYERRIIHSEIQNIEGVSTHSIGEDENRRVVISLTERKKPYRPNREKKEQNTEETVSTEENIASVEE